MSETSATQSDAESEARDVRGSQAPTGGRDWAGEVLAKVDVVVDKVHDKAVIPAVTVVRALVFGVIIGFMALASAVLLSVGFVRLLTNYVTDGKVWLSYLLVGLLFFIVGLFFWVKRKAPEAK